MKERFETFTILVTKIARSIRKIKTGEMAEFDLKSPHVSCLYYLYKGGPLTAKELCDICEEDKAAVSRSVEFLEFNGYLVYTSAAKKRYKSPFELTEKGREVGRIITQKIDKILDEASQGLSEADRIVFYKSFMLISNNLQKIAGKYED